MTPFHAKIEELKRLEKERTQGIWLVGPGGDVTTLTAVSVVGGNPERFWIGDCSLTPQGRADRAFIAAVANLIGPLIESFDKRGEGLLEAQKQLEMFNFAKDELRVRRADDAIIKALAFVPGVKE
jgi:hypothetical protein